MYIAKGINCLITVLILEPLFTVSPVAAVRASMRGSYVSDAVQQSYNDPNALIHSNKAYGYPRNLPQSPSNSALPNDNRMYEVVNSAPIGQGTGFAQTEATFLAAALPFLARAAPSVLSGAKKFVSSMAKNIDAGQGLGNSFKDALSAANPGGNAILENLLQEIMKASSKIDNATNIVEETGKTVQQIQDAPVDNKVLERTTAKIVDKIEEQVEDLEQKEFEKFSTEVRELERKATHDTKQQLESYVQQGASGNVIERLVDKIENRLDKVSR